MPAAFSVPQTATVADLPSSMTVARVTMDLFQHRYYKINKILMMLIGQWPYQNIGVRRGVVVALLSVGGIQLTPLLMALVKYRDDESILLDGGLALLFGAVALTKFIGFMGNPKKAVAITVVYSVANQKNDFITETRQKKCIARAGASAIVSVVIFWHQTTVAQRVASLVAQYARTLKLLNRIRTDWHEWARDPEINILHQYAEQQRKMIIAYIVMNITNHSVFIAQPMIPKIIDLFMNNGTKPGTFPYPVDFYHIDVQKYYFCIIAFSYVCAIAITIIIATNGVMLLCYVQHVCGIFAALGHKLEQLGHNRSLVKTRETRNALEKRDIALCINRHDGAIEYVNLIAASYSWTFFFTIAIGVIEFNIIGLQVLMKANHPEASIRFIIFVFSVTLYFYIDCYISETVTVHSINIYFCIHNSHWYKLSPEGQKLIQFMTMRCSVPCQLTAGKMLVMSMRGFWLTSKTALSYLTLVRSVQGL